MVCDETVYLSRRAAGRSSSERRLHDDEGCFMLQRVDDYREVDPADYPHHEDCAFCLGEVEQPDSHDTGPLEALKAAAEGGESA